MRDELVSRREMLLRLALAAAATGTAAGSGGPETLLRLSISEEVVKGVNRNDAAAAIGVWAQEMAKSVNLPLAANQRWVRPTVELVAAIRAGEVDAVCVTIPEYRQVAPHLDVTQVLTDTGAEMWLVVNEASGITGLGGLEGKHLILMDGPHTLLAEAWLTVMLAKEGMGTPGKVLGRMSRQTKATQAVLPVFFGQADACIVSRETLQTMFELNPQLAKKLKMLRSAPRLVSAFLGCRKSYPARAKATLFEKVVQARESPAGKQVTTLFHAFRFVMVDGEALRPSVVLLETAERLVQAVVSEKR